MDVECTYCATATAGYVQEGFVQYLATYQYRIEMKFTLDGVLRAHCQSWTNCAPAINNGVVTWHFFQVEADVCPPIGQWIDRPYVAELTVRDTLNLFLEQVTVADYIHCH